jgi:lysophospholipase L1-like esterase
MQLIDRLGAKLGINDSWSGTTVDGKNATDKTSISNIQRIQNLGSNGRPDVIVLFGGTNDYGLLDIVDKFDSTKMPTEVDLTTVQWGALSQAFAQTILRIKHFFPDTQIVAILPGRTSSYYSVTELREGNDLLAKVCDHYKVPYVDLFNGSLTTSHLPDGIHPAEEGMDIITDEVMKVMLEKCTVTPGESKTFAITHDLKNTKASLKFYHFVRSGEPFTETLSSPLAYTDVKITMGGVDITASSYKDNTVFIENVTGEISITATSSNNPITTVPETTVLEPETTVLEPDNTVSESEIPTYEPETSVSETAATQDGGCGSAIALAIIPALAACALTVKRKKK